MSHKQGNVYVPAAKGQNITENKSKNKQYN